MADPIQSEIAPSEKAIKKEKKQKKAKKAKKEVNEASTENMRSSPHVEENGATPKKRKREVLPDEIVVDPDLPEPLSKKELRKAKKAKTKPAATETTSGEGTTADQVTADSEEKPGKRGEYGVWIGNLPWSATKASLRTFLTENSEILNDQITRVHMPPPGKAANTRGDFKPSNKGFAYVDFATELAMYAAIALTETKMDGRNLLIKNAKSFDGRPKKEEGAEEGKAAGLTTKTGHPPNKRVFVGNLAFDITKEDLEEHFGQCGEILHIHMATFEDTGKCKGYAWITFENAEVATKAVQGYIFKHDDDDVKKEKKKPKKDDDDDENSSSSEQPKAEEKPKKAKKGRKWYINKLRGRDLRCEFAEDSTIRYNKRYGKKERADGDDAGNPEGAQFKKHPDRARGPPKERKKVDPRDIRPGAAHAYAPRASQAIVASEGKKITFE
jgi:RNA recognition motif-containing protein